MTTTKARPPKIDRTDPVMAGMWVLAEALMPGGRPFEGGDVASIKQHAIGVNESIRALTLALADESRPIPYGALDLLPSDFRRVVLLGGLALLIDNLKEGFQEALA